MTQKTPLFDLHQELGGKMVEFGGYALPISYPSGVIKEHQAVRTQAGLFDVSHMAEIRVCGANALNYINLLMTNNFTTLKDGRMRYTLMCNDRGTIVDDLLVYRFNEHDYRLVCNAANHAKDIDWLTSHLIAGVELHDESHDIAMIALQGPHTNAILNELMNDDDIPTVYYSFKDQVMIGDIQCLVSRNGYTGEDGVEIYVAANQGEALYRLLLATEQCVPCGLGCRDTLRLEAAMPLYGHEMDDTINPLEAGLGMFVKMSKDHFIGRSALEKPVTRSRVGLKMIGRGIAREHMEVSIGGVPIGIVTSGTHLPTLKYAGAMALIQSDQAMLGNTVTITVRDKEVIAEIVALPFYKR